MNDETTKALIAFAAESSHSDVMSVERAIGSDSPSFFGSRYLDAPIVDAWENLPLSARAVAFIYASYRAELLATIRL
jgi:hypothetical protein